MSRTAAAGYAADATRQLLTLATAVLAVTVTFVSDVAPDAPASAKIVMSLGWLALLVCVVAGVACLFAITAEVAAVEAEGPPDARVSIRRRPVLVTAQAQAVGFLVGLVLISAAAVLSLV